MANEPLAATALGDRRFDDMLPDITPGGRLKAVAQYQEFLRRAQAVDSELLSAPGKVTAAALLVEVKSVIDYISCGLDDWTVDPLGGPQVEFMNVESYQPVRTSAEAAAMVNRWAAMGPFLDAHVANLSSGLGSGKVSVKVGVEKVVDEIQDLLGKPDAEWPLLRPLGEPHEGWSKDESNRFREGLTSAVKTSVRPAFARYLEFLRAQVLPRARPQEKPGILHVEGGLEAYQQLIRVHTSLDLTPQELHQTGLNEVAKINGEMEELGEKVFGTRDRRLILQKLRGDSSLYFSSRDEVAETAEKALERARAAIPKWFGRLPKTGCEVVRMAEHEEKHSTIAYYRPPAADGSRSGRYYVNTSEPQTRPRYEAEALAYHESIPGHHLQIAIAQELQGIPEFRKNSGVTAFIEGWGLYSERLSDEMGLYSSDLDRVGVLSYDSWRACRLVVDTGMHALGWSRTQAIDYMIENSALAKNNIVNEVDRYIAWPGQALAYKTGQLEMLKLRRRAERKMESRFEVRAFHDALLGDGAVPLQTLREILEAYTES